MITMMIQKRSEILGKMAAIDEIILGFNVWGRDRERGGYVRGKKSVLQYSLKIGGCMCSDNRVKIRASFREG